MIGARNENSVLFSAANLAQVAQGSSYGSAPNHPQPEPFVGHASGDESGLIDIRALAAMASPAAQPATSQELPTGASGPVPVTRTATDDLLDSPKVFTPDTLAPVTPEDTGRPRSLSFAILGVAAIAAAAVVGVAYVLRPGSDDSQSASSATSAITEAPEPAPSEPAAAPEPAPEEASAEEPQAAEEPEPEEPVAAAKAEPALGGRKPAVGALQGLERQPRRPRTPEERAAAAERRRLAAERRAEVRAERQAAREAQQAERQRNQQARAAQGRAGAGEKPAARAKTDRGEQALDDLLAPSTEGKPASKPSPRTAAAAPADDGSLDDLITGAAEKKKPASGKGRSMDELLDMAVAEDAPKTKPKLPETPGRDDVMKAMGGVRGAVNKCAKDAGETGVATVQVTVQSSGRVSGANVTGITGPAGSCIARAVRRARFPAFAKSTFSVKFPFRIK